MALVFSNFGRHIKLVHDNVKAFECERCTKSFSTKINLTQHNCTSTQDKNQLLKSKLSATLTEDKLAKHARLVDEHK